MPIVVSSSISQKVILFEVLEEVFRVFFFSEFIQFCFVIYSFICLYFFWSKGEINLGLISVSIK